MSGTALASLHCSHHFHRSSLTSHHTSLTPLSTPILYPFSSHTTLNTNLTHCCLSHTPLSTPSQATASLLPSVTKTSHLTLLPLFLSLSHSLSLSLLSLLSLSLSLSLTHTHAHTHTHHASQKHQQVEWQATPKQAQTLHLRAWTASGG